MSVWVEWWRGRSLRAERAAEQLSEVVDAIMDRWGPCFAEWIPAQDALKDYRDARGRPVNHGSAGFWSERAMNAEQHADRLATVIEAVSRHHYLPFMIGRDADDALRLWREGRELRYGSLPAGPTQIGNLTSGGVHV